MAGHVAVRPDGADGVGVEIGVAQLPIARRRPGEDELEAGDERAGGAQVLEERLGRALLAGGARPFRGSHARVHGRFEVGQLGEGDDERQ